MNRLFPPSPAKEPPSLLGKYDGSQGGFSFTLHPTVTSFFASFPS
jgi:hypothetical protein